MTVEIRSLYVEDQIESLPYANPDKVAEWLLAALQSLNQVDIRAVRRIALLELYAKPYRFLLDAGRASIPSLSVPALERNRRMLDTNRRIALALAFGYKQAAGQHGTETQLRCQAQQRSMAYLCHALMHCYHAYRPLPAGLWRELHSLPRRAEDPDFVFASPILPDDMQQSVEKNYRRILLVSLVDPFHLSLGEVWLVHQASTDWTELLEVSGTDNEAGPGGRFIITPGSDSRPAPVPHARNGRPPAGTLYLDTRRVLAAVSALPRDRAAGQADAAPDTATTAIPQPLLRRMSRDWGLPPKRHAPRAPGDGQVRIASGLSAAHHFVSDPTVAAHEAADPDTGDLVIGDVEALPATASARYRLEEWRVANRGPVGLCIFNRAQPTQLLRVGELLVVGGANGGSWSVGVIRWLRSIAPSGYQAGIQLIGDSAAATSARRLHDDQPDGPVSYALRLDATNGDPDRSSLVAPRGLFEAGTRLVLQGPGGAETVQVDGLVEATVAFESFRVQRLQ